MYLQVAPIEIYVFCFVLFLRKEKTCSFLFAAKSFDLRMKERPFFLLLFLTLVVELLHTQHYTFFTIFVLTVHEFLQSFKFQCRGTCYIEILLII